MMSKNSQIMAGIIFCLLPALSIWADSDWKAKESSNFTLFYREGSEWNADEVLSNLEHYRERVIKLTGNKKMGHTFLTIHDAGLVPGGYYNPIFDVIGLFPYPPSASPLSSVENWSRLVGVHEYTHRMQITNTGGLPGFATSLFGTPFHPNLWSPGWIMEGITTYSESQLSPYEGRLNDGFYTSYLSARAKEGKFPTLNSITHTPFEMPYGDSYYLCNYSGVVRIQNTEVRIQNSGVRMKKPGKSKIQVSDRGVVFHALKTDYSIFILNSDS